MSIFNTNYLITGHTPFYGKFINRAAGCGHSLQRFLRSCGCGLQMSASVLMACMFLAAVSPATSQVNVGNMGFEYSLLVKDSVGRAKPGAPVALQIYLLPGQTSQTTDAVWAETQNITTDAYGFTNIVIGNGTKSGGTAASFSTVNFSTTAYWVLIQVYNTATNTYQTFIKDALAAAPYAKVAGTIAATQSMPPGVVIPFAGDTSQIPTGWLLCDGRELDNTNPLYQPLFNAISFNWGTSDNNQKFNIPNLADVFLKGAIDIAIQGSYSTPSLARVASAPGSNTGPNVGSFEQDAFLAHQHPSVIFGTPGGSTNAVFSTTGSYVSAAQLATVLVHKGDFGVGPALDASGTPKASPYETRPVNVAVNYIIKL